MYTCNWALWMMSKHRRSILRYVYFYFYSILHASLPPPQKKQNWARLHHYLQSSRIGDPLLTLCSEIANFNQLTSFVEYKMLFYSMMNPSWKFVSQTSFMPWNYQRKHLWSCPRVKTQCLFLLNISEQLNLKLSMSSKDCSHWKH